MANSSRMIATTVVVLVLAGCGDEGGSSGDGPSYFEAQIRKNAESHGAEVKTVSCGALRADDTAACTMVLEDGTVDEMLWWYDDKATNDIGYGAYQLIRCSDMKTGAVRARFAQALTLEIIAEVQNRPGYPGAEFVRDGVNADIDTFCRRAVNPNYEPWDDIVDDVSAAVETIG